MAVKISVGDPKQYVQGRDEGGNYGISVGFTHRGAYPGAPDPGPQYYITLELRYPIVPAANCTSISFEAAYATPVNNAGMVAPQTYSYGIGTANAYPTTGYGDFKWDVNTKTARGLVVNGNFKAGQTYYLWLFFRMQGQNGGYAKGVSIVNIEGNGEVAAPYITIAASGNADVGGASPTLTSSATAEPGASLSYQWYQGNNPINGATDSTYSVPTTASGVFSYKCVATATKDGASASTTSNSVNVTIYQAASLSVSKQPKSASYIQNRDATALSVEVAPTGGTARREGAVSYQWYKDGTPILGATWATCVPSTAQTGSYAYYCIVRNVVGTTETSVRSSTATISVTAQAPVITVQPKGATYKQAAPATALTVAATVGTGTLSYRWYKNGSAITNATSASYTPSTATIGTAYYSCTVTNTSGASTASTASASAKVVTQTPVPVFSGALNNATYVVGSTVSVLNGTAVVFVGTLSYQWYQQLPGKAATAISGATSATYTPDNSTVGTFFYYVIAKNVSNGVTYSAKSNVVTIQFVNAYVTEAARYQAYLKELKRNFTKVVRADFLNPDGSIAFSLDGQAKNRRSSAFIADGNLSVNLQNGARRQANMTLSNLDGAYDYAVNRVWFGQEIKISEGLILPDGTEYLIPQGVFMINTPREELHPNTHTMTYPLVDKWAYLDGSLFGNLEGTYEVDAGTNIFDAMSALLKLNRFDMSNNGATPIDRIAPLCTEWYNNKTQTLTDGTQVNLVDAPYDLMVDGEGGTFASILTGLADMLAAWIGYNAVGRLCIDPSQDDVLDSTKPVEWAFEPDETQFLGATYTIQNTQVYNDVIVVGATNDDATTARGRAQNQNPASDTCVSRIGLKTIRVYMPDFYSDQVCEDYAAWLLKRYAILTKSVTIESTQLFHIQENSLVTIRRPDKDWQVERHLVMGYTRPLSGKGNMTINAISCNDLLDVATIVKE